MWSHDTGVDNQLSRHADKCAEKVKQKWTKSTIGQQPQRIKIKADKNPKRCKYFTTETIKVHDPISGHVITIQVWTINILVTRPCGWTEKSQNGQKHHRTTAPKDKNQCGQDIQKMKIFFYSNHQGARSHFWSCDHMIQVFTINILVMRSR